MSANCFVVCCTGWTRFMEWKYPLDRFIEKENGVGGGKGSVKAYASL